MRQQKPDRHQHQNAGRGEESRKLLSVQVVRLMQRKKPVLRIMEQPAMDRILDQSENGKTKQGIHDRQRPTPGTTESQIGEDKNARKVAHVRRPVVRARRRNHVQK